MKKIKTLATMAIVACAALSSAYADQARPPRPPRPPHGRGGLCEGTYTGMYSNGVRGSITLDGRRVVAVLNGQHVFTGWGDCRERFGRADVHFRITNPGPAQGDGTIRAGRDGRDHMRVHINNGLVFNGVR